MKRARMLAGWPPSSPWPPCRSRRPRRFPPLQQFQRPRQRRHRLYRWAGWVSEGWWNIKTNIARPCCAARWPPQFYYTYAMDERGGEWKGKAFMCTRDREFRIEGRENCFLRGYDRTGFFEVDTGKDARNWTVQLTDPNPTH